MHTIGSPARPEKPVSPPIHPRYAHPMHTMVQQRERAERPGSPTVKGRLVDQLRRRPTTRLGRCRSTSRETGHRRTADLSRDAITDDSTPHDRPACHATPFRPILTPRDNTATIRRRGTDVPAHDPFHRPYHNVGDLFRHYLQTERLILGLAAVYLETERLSDSMNPLEYVGKRLAAVAISSSISLSVCR